MEDRLPDSIIEWICAAGTQSLHHHAYYDMKVIILSFGIIEIGANPYEVDQPYNCATIEPTSDAKHFELVSESAATKLATSEWRASLRVGMHVDYYDEWKVPRPATIMEIVPYHQLTAQDRRESDHQPIASRWDEKDHSDRLRLLVLLSGQQQGWTTRESNLIIPFGTSSKWVIRGTTPYARAIVRKKHGDSPSYFRRSDVNRYTMATSMERGWAHHKLTRDKYTHELTNVVGTSLLSPLINIIMSYIDRLVPYDWKLTINNGIPRDFVEQDAGEYIGHDRYTTLFPHSLFM
jgi:hypothetical protein